VIVMKFGGTSVADAERIRAVAEIVRARLELRPVVVVSALGNVTDLLERAVDLARRDELTALDPVLAEIERSYRWALAGSVAEAGLRHDLSLELGVQFDDLRQRLRSIRILREGTPRTIDALLAVGELLAARVVAAAFEDQGLPSCCVDARDVMRTDNRFGAATPLLESVRERCEKCIAPLVGEGRLPVLGGFVGMSGEGETTTLGRGGSDTSAATLALALEARELQIWTDVNGLMTADPRLVPEARSLERVSFSEAVELAQLGARVLHPHTIAPAVQRDIPVRVLNSRDPDGVGTQIVGLEPAPATMDRLTSLASRSGLTVVRAARVDLAPDASLGTRLTDAMARLDCPIEVVVGGGVAVSVAVSGQPDPDSVERELGEEIRTRIETDRALVGVVGPALANDAALTGEVVQALSRWQPDLIAQGASPNGLICVLRSDSLVPALRELHRNFFATSHAP
jgi:aspartate kinase